MIENTILENLPTKFLELHQNEIIIGWKEGKPYLDLQTGMKSHLYLSWKDGQYVAEGRYDTKVVIETFSDLTSAIRRCECGRGFMNSSWAEVFENGFGEFNFDKFE